MRFADVLNQYHAIGLLRSALRTGRVHHAYLFVGPAGTGRRETAWAFAQALQCADYVEDACGVCLPCQKSERRVHPDIRWIEPLEGRQGIGIDQVRELRQEAVYGPYEGKYRVYIVAPAERLLPEAQNALLKLLEEPPPRTVILLVAESPHALLPTVVSRAQLVRFNLVAAADIERALRVQFEVPPVRARVLAALCAGRAALATRWARDPNALADRDRVVDWFRRVEQEGLLAALEVVESLAQERERLAELLDIALLWYRDVLIEQHAADERLLVNLDRREEIRQLAAHLGPEAVYRRLEAIERAKAELRRHVQPRLVLEAMFLQFGLHPTPTASSA
ncbi:MAG: DNA polymerase III subunit delta' [Armatimonadetes bacterium]|nr:DNA polymerase III subunit delta' [Armatimonadota bacterium]MDW8154261.1 DNA polymerase III subunit delta' [Armatimonadota bacterium]